MMYRVKALIILALLYSASAQTNMNPDEKTMIPRYINLMFLALFLLAFCIIQSFLISYNVPIPYTVFVIIAGILMGVAAKYNEVVLDSIQLMNIYPADVLNVYVPVVIFKVALTVDVYLFFKTLPQIIIIGVPVALFSGCLFGLMFRLIMGYKWSIFVGLYFGLICVPTYPQSILYLLKEQSRQTKHISVLLEGEALVSLVVIEMVQTLMLSNYFGIVVEWYQFVFLLLRFIILSFISGYALGLMGRYLIRKMYTNHFCILVMTFGLPIFTHALAQLYLSGCGALTVLVVGMMISTLRGTQATEMEELLVDTWQLKGFVVDVVVCWTASATAALHASEFMELHDYVLMIVAYLIYYVVRFVSFLLFSPIISRLSYGITLKHMIVCVWGGLKSPYQLELATYLMELGFDKKIAQTMFFEIIGLYVFSMLVNGSLTRLMLDCMGLRTISMARQINMTNCMKHILLKRERTIAILKNDRFLRETNWPMVIEATNMKYPYARELGDDEDYNIFGGYRSNFCPDCKKNFLGEPTPKELKEMKREANMRLLKARKMSFARQYENGMISKDALQILNQAIELAMDSENAVIELQGLEKQFYKENWIARVMKMRHTTVSKGKVTTIRMPRKFWRRICYRIVMNNTFERYMLYLIAFHVILIAADMSLYPMPVMRKQVARIAELDTFFLIVSLFFSVIYSLEFVMKVLAYAFIHIWDQGVRTYFKSFWNITDFIALCGILLDAFLRVGQVSAYVIFVRLRQIDDVLLLLRAVRLLRFIEIFYPKLVTYFDKGLDAKMAFTYELGKSYATGEAELLDMLPYMIDNTKIRDDIKRKIEVDRVLITKLLGVVQKEKPWIAITVKTKQAIRTILSNMREIVHELIVSGWIDDYEQDKLTSEIEELYKTVNAIKSVQPSAPKVIFKEVAWMAGDQDVIDFLFENVTVKTFEPGDIVFKEGNVAEGIYIVVTGLFMITYNPDKSVVESLQEFGRLPIVDYLSPTQYVQPMVDYIVSGNCIGELSTLTQRAFNCVITADAHSQVYVLSHGILKRAMELSPDPFVGLESRIWKEVSVRIAVSVLMSVPAYHNYSQDQIKYALERSFVPNLSLYKVFSVSEMIQEVILIEGVAADFNTRETFIAPWRIPKTVQKLILPTSSLMKIPIDIETKLLIIPEKDVDEYDVMLVSEETCEMISLVSSTRCLQHVIQKRAKERKRRIKNMKSSSIRQIRSKNVISDNSEEGLKSIVTIKTPTESADKISDRMFEEEEKNSLNTKTKQKK